MNGDEISVRVVIEGRVQMVWFRGWTLEQAHTRGLRGWVRNRRDGAVEALFTGPGPAVEDMIAACRQGPPAARVAKISRFPAEDGGGRDFRPLPTA